MTTEFDKEVAHLSRLGQLPGWKDFVWHRLKELDDLPEYRGIKDRVVLEIRRRAAPAATESR